ncbi:shikimate 5-dehydrogenase [Paenibacillus sp. WQ 127069]|uniref:Shikimate 5-dehydrogenase n=1 Tax=Paenibacillus baimaensis TaxID=2982185 RepID=A0ABT2UUG9_9BACL|nr:shikimate 5-dehydrogenase [Paenibacillus sp. WQ 127069]MCU6798295.1 shikimate 5-dehydrogenase [Paenibacillus sp. WQ 127069]
MNAAINKDTQLCMSLAGRPGNFGTRFHNFLYNELNLNFIYKAFTTNDLQATIGGIRSMGIRGCAISMPYKEACIPFIDEMDESATAIQSVNTIVNDQGRLKAYNTDYIAVSQLLNQHNVRRDSVFALRGSGGMAKAVLCALHDAGFGSGFVVARNEVAGRALAQAYGYEWTDDLGRIRPELLVNVTPVGMAGGLEADDLSFEPDFIEKAETVFDVVALPAETPLIRHARLKSKKVITGAEVFAIQALEQFILYTGVRPTDEQFKRAAAYARG